MTEPIAYLNGQIVPFSKAALSVCDMGVVGGTSVPEMIRTFRHQPFRLDPHLDRLEESLRLTGIRLPVTRDELVAICTNVVSQNAKLIPADHDLGLIVFVTAGQNLTYLGRKGLQQARTPTLCVHTFPLPFELWADEFTSGLHLVTTTVRSLPDDVINSRIKHRSRLHWHLAALEARRQDPEAMALLTDHEGYLTETGTGNLIVVEGTTLLTPASHVLDGISRDFLAELASSIGLTMASTRLLPEDLQKAREAFLTSTPHCMLPVTKFNGQPIGDGVPGPLFHRLINAWSDAVGVDIMAQMRNGANSRER